VKTSKFRISFEFRTAEAAAEFVREVAPYVSDRPVTAYLLDQIDKTGGVKEYVVKHLGDRPEAFEMEEMRVHTKGAAL